MSSEAGRGRSRRAVATVATAAILLVPLASSGCGLKGDPLPPLRPPEPAEEEVQAGTKAATEDSAEGEDDADATVGESGEGEASENAESEDADPEADDSHGADAEPEADDSDGEDADSEADDGEGEEDGGGAQGPA